MSNDTNNPKIAGSLQRFVRRLNPARHLRQRQRNIDHEVLFPIIRAKAPNEVAAASAIATHCANDSAWECDPAEYSERDTNIIIEIARLLPPNAAGEPPATRNL